MEKNWFIYAYPEMYGGLHGMYNYEVVFNASYKEVCEWGFELAGETVDSYLRADEIYSMEEYMEEFHNGEEWDEQYREDYWDAFNEMRDEQCSYYVYPLKDNVTEQDYQNWQKKNLAPDDFIKHYCRQLTEEDCV